jgi:hypothetical protein
MCLLPVGRGKITEDVSLQRDYRFINRADSMKGFYDENEASLGSLAFVATRVNIKLPVSSRDGKKPSARRRWKGKTWHKSGTGIAESVP